MPRPLRPLLAMAHALGALALALSEAVAHEPAQVPIADLTRRIAAAPESLSLYLQRGELRRAIGDHRGAGDDYAAVERLDPRHPQLGVCRAALALDTGDPAAACRLLDAVLVQRPVDPEALALRARAKVALGRRGAAVADLATAISHIERPAPDLFLERARLQVAEGDRTGARLGLDEARARIGVSTSLELFAIELDLADGRAAEARAQFEALAAHAAVRSALEGLDARIAAAERLASPGAGVIPAAEEVIAPTSGAAYGRRPAAPVPIRFHGTTRVVQVLGRHAAWRYNATGVDLGTSWRQASYADTSWPAGAGALGYGEPDVGTVVPFGPDPLNRYPTTYFRTTFVMPSPLPTVTSLTMNARFDDGIVVYLNGVEAARRSIRSGTVTYGSLALSHEASAYETIDLSGARSALLPGTNLLAVEVHQASPDSPDLVWDADLAFSDLPHLTRGPYLQMGTDSAVTVRWRTSEPTDSRVMVGTSPESLATAASLPTLTTEHELRVTGLAPATRYYYAVGSTTDVLAGDSSYTFRTAPTAESSAGARVWVVGDSGLPGSVASAVRDAYSEWTGTRGTDLWLMLGDNAYSNGTDSEYEAAVFNQYPVPLRQCVLWPTRGNHDDLHAGVDNDYYEIFTMPSAGEAGGMASGTEAYYSFNWSNVHFICLDSEGSDRSPSGAMMTWLASDLAANVRPWVVAFWHHPPYSKGSHDSDGETALVQMRQYALPVLEAGGADLVLCGHSHSYERSFLLDGHYGTSVTLTPEMIVDGGPGHPDGDGAYVKPVDAPAPRAGAVYAVSGSASSTAGGSLDHPVMVASLNVAGSMVLDFHGNRLDARFISHAGAVLDSFSIVKTGVVGVERGSTPGVRLHPVLPNPFRGDVRLGYAIERAGPVRLSIYDPSGRRMTVVEEGWRGAGAHEARWDGLGPEGRRLPNGVYLAVLEAGGARVSRKVAHVR